MQVRIWYKEDMTMSIESCITFLREIVDSNELKQQMKAVTDSKEVIAIGKRLGYTFDAHDLAAASASFSEQSDSLGTASQTKWATYVNSAFYHYELDMEQIPGFEEVSR